MSTETTDENNSDPSNFAGEAGTTQAEEIETVPLSDDEGNRGIRDCSASLPPDGGYGWVVTFASFMCHFIADGISFSYGVIYPALLETFNSSKSKTSWAGSIFIGVPLLTAPIAGFIVNRFGARIATIFGGLITAVGLLASAYVNSIEMLCFTYGGVAGFGLSFVYVSSTVIPSFWFEKKRALATGIAVSGSGVGTFAMAPFIEFLLNQYGWKGTLLILAGVSLNCAVLGALYRSPRTNITMIRGETADTDTSNYLTKRSRILEFDQIDVERAASLPTIYTGPKVLAISPQSPTNSNTRCQANPTTFSKSTNRSHPTNNELNLHRTAVARSSAANTNKPSLADPHIFVSSRSLLPISRHDISSVMNMASRQRTISSCPTLSMHCEDYAVMQEPNRLKKCWAKSVEIMRELCDPSIMLKPLYLMFFISNFLLCYSYDIPYVYIPDYANSLGILKSYFLISIIGIVNTFGQVLYGFLGDRKSINVILLYGGSILFCGILISLVPVMKDFGSLAVFCVLYGLAISASFALETVVVIKILSLQQLTKAYSMLMFGQGVAGLIGPPIGGWLWDTTGDYVFTFVFAGLSCALSGVLAMCILCIKNKLPTSNNDISISGSG